jgi:DNA-binding NarL/FixJ family response regulator
VEVPVLSAVEQEVVALVAQGRSEREIAEALRVSPKTVEWHVARARRKLERAAAVHDRVRDVSAPTKEER